jgi:hypothetical protein
MKSPSLLFNFEIMDCWDFKCMMIVMALMTTTRAVLNLSCIIHFTSSFRGYIVLVRKTTDVGILADLQVLSFIDKQK